MGLNPMTGVLIRENRQVGTQGEGHVKMDPGTGVMLTQAKEHQGLPATTRS